MKLYLVQHGDALSKEADPDRPLSEKGRADVRHVAEFLAGQITVARVLHSGKTRARQTAEILAAAAAPGQEIATVPGIDPLDPVEPIAQQAQNWNEDSLIAGHQPFMGRLVARLVTGSEESAVVTYQPGSVTCLERDDSGNWTVAWMLRPELFAS